MRFERSAGILLHLTSLPGHFGIGDLGDEALRFVDFLRAAGQSYWQILPVGPSDDGNPYVSQSSWAGSPYLISLEELARTGDVTPEELESARVPASDQVDFRAVATNRETLLTRAAGRFLSRGGEERERFDRFCEESGWWLEDWVLFAAARHGHGRKPWWQWPCEQAHHTVAGLEEIRTRFAERAGVERYVQFRFFEQWRRVRRRAAEAGIRFVGDVPFYCARDSADVWASPDRFLLDANLDPEVVSGTPPDYYAAEGQHWGTPVYRWARHEEERYAWWIARLRGALKHVDVVRIDHFRAFESYWEIPRGRSAKEGRWEKGPGDGFFAAVRDALGEAPFVAEDLGTITKGVRELRDRWELPGMRVLHFAFGEGAASPHLPIWYPRNSVVYTGTHDNDTSVGWYEKASVAEREALHRFAGTAADRVHLDLARIAYGSVADLAVVPMQDVLGLGSAARMNVPGLAEGNWGWKLVDGQANEQAARRMYQLAETYGRLPGQRQAID